MRQKVLWSLLGVVMLAAMVAVEAQAPPAQPPAAPAAHGLPHTFFNRTNLDELAGPFRMDVREHPKGGRETVRVDRAGVFDVARAFFSQHLR